MRLLVMVQVEYSRSSRSMPLAQRRKIDLYDIPESVFPNRVILVAQPVSEGTYCSPGLIWHQRGSHFPELGGSFTDSFQTALYSIVSF